MEDCTVPTEASESPSSAIFPTLPELVSHYKEQLARARQAGDFGTILSAANSAADAIEQRVASSAGIAPEAERAALIAAQALLFNAAADCWPGWSIDAAQSPPSAFDLAAGLRLAQRSSQLVHRLALGAVREGTARWMIGAYELASRHFDLAIESFSHAAERYVHAPAPGLALLARGYAAIAHQAAGKPLPAGAGNLDEVRNAIQSGGFKDAQDWLDQLSTASQLFA